MNMQDYTTPFAINGDRDEFSINTDPSGNVSLERGWTEPYQLRPEEGGKFIPRRIFNQMMNLVSTDTVTWKTQTFSNWIADKGDGTPYAYPKNAIVKYTNGNVYVSKVANNTTVPTNTTNWLLYNPANGYVELTGNQTIAGVKTFSSSPIVPVPTTDFQSVPLKSTSIAVNVGVGQTYTTINQALEYLSGFYPMYKKGGVAATINLKAGFVMAEQVLVSGIDLGWITIVGEDAETIITHTALTTAFNGTNYPVFGVDKGGTSPVIGKLFRFNVEKVGGNKHGIMTFGAGSSANVLSGCGFIGAGHNGIYADRASTINANGANVSNAGVYGILAADSSTINANGANVSNAGSVGIFASESSTINANLAIIQNQTTGTAGVLAIGGAHIYAYGINTTGGTVPVLSQAANTLTSNGIIYQ